MSELLPGGVTRTKAPSRLLTVRLEDFQGSIDWFKRFLLRNFDFKTELVVLDAPVSLWRFRDAAEGVVNISHDLVERAEVALQAIEDHDRMKAYMADKDKW